MTQKNFVRMLKQTAKATNLQVHLVAHMRKGESEQRMGDKMDIKGSSEIADLADYAFIVWKNIKKAEDILDYHKFNYQQWVPIRERSKPGWDSDDWSDYFSSWEVWTEDHALAMKLKLLDNGKSMTKSILYTGYYPILYKP